MLVLRLPVYYKQRDMHFFPPFHFALSSIVLRLPWIFVDTWIWTAFVYFLVIGSQAASNIRMCLGWEGAAAEVG